MCVKLTTRLNNSQNVCQNDNPVKTARMCVKMITRLNNSQNVCQIDNPVK